jgi:hypothetical protein
MNTLNIILLFVYISLSHCEDWKYIKHAFQSSNNINNIEWECSKACILNDNCYGWSLVHGDIELGYVNCYLESKIMTKIIDDIPKAFINNRHLLIREVKSIQSVQRIQERLNFFGNIQTAYYSPYRVPIDNTDVIDYDEFDDEFYIFNEEDLLDLTQDTSFQQVSHLINGPVVTSSSTLLSYQQQFFRGCKYSISLWVWIWKKKKSSPVGQEEIIFSTRESDLRNVDDEHISDEIFPSILFNVGSHPERLFFSISKDKYGGYLGFFPNFNVRFNEWMHLTLTIDDNIMGAYINGKLIEQVLLNHDQSGGRHYCPYYPSSPMPLKKPQFNNSFSILNASSINKIKYNTNNTILQIGSNKGLTTLTGMFQSFFVVRNSSLSEVAINILMEETYPAPMPTFDKLLKHYGIFSLDNFCPISWENDYFIMAQWGVCPDIVCGSICLDPRFLLGIPLGNLKFDDYDSNDDINEALSKNISTLSIEEISNLLDENIKEIGLEYIIESAVDDDFEELSLNSLDKIDMQISDVYADIKKNLHEFEMEYNISLNDSIISFVNLSDQSSSTGYYSPFNFEFPKRIKLNNQSNNNEINNEIKNNNINGSNFYNISTSFQFINNLFYQIKSTLIFYNILSNDSILIKREEESQSSIMTKKEKKKKTRRRNIYF